MAVIVPLLVLLAPAFADDPDAGVIPSLTDGAVAVGSGNASALPNLLDEDTATHWQSDACYPTGYLSRPDLDVALGRCAAGACSGTTADSSAITDGTTSAGVDVPLAGDAARLRVALAVATPLQRLRVFGTFAASVDVVGETADGATVVLGALPASTDARTAVNLDVTATDPLVAVRLESASAMRLHEVAALSDTCFVWAGADLGAPTEIGWVRLRHWAGGSTERSQLMVSDDGVTWTSILALDPDSLAMADHVLAEPVTARYLAVRHDLVDGDWQKAYVWELDAYGADGFYGPAPAPAPNAVTFADLVGVNGIWGWGTSAYSDDAAAGSGPDRWAGLHARNYHNLAWDVTDPDHVPDYDAMAAGEGTEAQWWLDWDREYGAWVDRGVASIDVSVQFTDDSFPESAFGDPWQAGFGYGEAFAAHFGPTVGNGLVDAVEVGNEPWDYSAGMYSAYLAGMVAGVESGDPAMQVLAGAFQAHTPELEGAVGGTYMGARVPEGVASTLDAINVHAYSFAYDEAGTRRGVRPEHAVSSMREIFAALRWRDANAPGAPVWLTEWGWDSEGGGETCTGTECVSEQAQARYLVRGAMLGARWGLSRMTWYFYANVEGSSGLFGRSGLLASKATGFAPKRGYVALQALCATIGDRRFLAVVREDDEVYAYVLGDADGAPTHLIAWAPIDGDDTTVTQVSVDAQGLATEAFTLDGASETGEPTDVPVVWEGLWTLPVSAAPVVVAFAPVDPGDTGEVDSGEADSGSADSGSGPDDDAEGAGDGCGCGASGSSAGAASLLLAFVGVARRRGRASASRG